MLKLNERRKQDIILAHDPHGKVEIAKKRIYEPTYELEHKHIGILDG
jgi:hypothetical protein